MAIGSGPVKDRSTREGLVRAGAAAWAVVGILVLVFFALWLLSQIGEIFPPLVLALAIIFLLNPIVSRLQRVGVPRALGTAVVYLVVIMLLVLIVAAISPVMGRQFEELGDRLPELQQSLIRLGENVAGRFGVSLEESLSTGLDRLREQLFSGVGQITRIAGGALHLVLTFVLAPFIALYLLIDLPRLQKAFIDHLPPQYRDDWLELLRKCGGAVGSFFRGQLLVAAIVGTLAAVSLLIIKVPFWLPLGILVGFFNLIPLIGPFVGGAIAVVVAAVDGGLGRALAAAIAMVAIQQLDNHFITPNVIGRTLRLHPVTIILALIAGGAIGGLFGMLLAVPATGVGKILILHYYSVHVLGRDPDEEQLTAEAEEMTEPPPASETAGAKTTMPAESLPDSSL